MEDGIARGGCCGTGSVIENPDSNFVKGMKKRRTGGVYFGCLPTPGIGICSRGKRKGIGRRKIVKWPKDDCRTKDWRVKEKAK